MKLIPIAFAFDNNLITPACVCITSLILNAKEGTKYDIFILHSKDDTLDKGTLDKLAKAYPEKCQIRYVEVDNTFSNAFEIRGVTKATYYRLLLPNLITDYDRIIYSDVDITFQMDLSEVYDEPLDDNYIAATLDLGLNYLDTKHINEIEELEIGKYIQAGFIVFNLKKMREDGIVSKFIELSKKDFEYQDQDILNISCKGKIKYLKPEYNVNDCAFIVLKKYNVVSHLFSKEVCEFARKNGNIHFSGKKPWKQESICMDLWWEYYRKSIIFDVDYYFDFFFNRTFILDSLSLWKRVKILIRFFVYGRAKI